MAKILIADDEPDIRDLVRQTLERDGHEILETGDGPSTLALLRRQPVHLLILDVMLPGMDGHTLQLHMSQEESTRDIPVLILTALHPSKVLFDKFPQVVRFMAKPFDPLVLANQVAKILSKD